MEKRRLGRTGHMSSVVAFGTAGIGRVDQETADKAMQTCLDYGVNHIDVAPGYGEAEVRIGPWMPKIRDQVFLGCKTNIRDAAGSWDECQRSLERLQTDRFDLYQLALGRQAGRPGRGARRRAARWRRWSRRRSRGSPSTSGSRATPTMRPPPTWRRCAASTSTR